jgi:Type IV secretion system pilin
MIKSFFAFAKLAALVVLSTLAMTMPAQAKSCTPGASAAFFQPIPTWYHYLELDENCEVKKFDIPGDINKVAIAVIEILLRVSGIIAFGYVVFGGFKYVLSRGNSSETAKARQTIIDAVIGIAITSIATVLVGFLGRALSQ